MSAKVKMLKDVRFSLLPLSTEIHVYKLKRERER